MSGRGVIMQEPEQFCEMCGPYGPNDEQICFDCGMKDEETTRRKMSAYVFGETE